MATTRAHADTIPLRGGHVALDFVNTAGWHASDQPKEWLVDFAELARWGAHAGLYSADESLALRVLADADPGRAERVRRRAIALREALFRICRASVVGESAAESDLARVQDEYADAVRHASLAPAGPAFALAWDSSEPALEAPLWRVAAAAVELLASDAMERLRECGGHPCGWLFVDRSRNRSRRWCSSEECGNRERVRKHVAARH